MANLNNIVKSQLRKVLNEKKYSPRVTNRALQRQLNKQNDNLHATLRDTFNDLGNYMDSANEKTWNLQSDSTDAIYNSRKETNDNLNGLETSSRNRHVALEERMFNQTNVIRKEIAALSQKINGLEQTINQIYQIVGNTRQNPQQYTKQNPQQ